MKKRTIFILGTTICFLYLIGRVSFAQDLNIVYLNTNSYDPSDAPVSTLLQFNYVPVVQPNTSNLDLIDVRSVSYKNLDLTGYVSSWGGYHKEIYIDGRQGFSQLWFADENNVYSFWPGLTSVSYQNKFFSRDALIPYHLGSISDRKNALIFLDRLTVSPVDFRNMLSGWIWAGIAIFIALPMLWILKKFLRR